MEVEVIQTDFNRIKKALEDCTTMGIKEGYREATLLLMEIATHRGMSFNQKAELVILFRGLPRPY